MKITLSIISIRSGQLKAHVAYTSQGKPGKCVFGKTHRFGQREGRTRDAELAFLSLCEYWNMHDGYRSEFIHFLMLETDEFLLLEDNCLIN